LFYHPGKKKRRESSRSVFLFEREGECFFSTSGEREGEGIGGRV